MGFWSALLGREKASPVAPLMVQSTTRPHPMPHDFKAYAREAYERNIIAYRCIALIAEAAASVPLQLYRGDRVVDDHPIVDALDRPNPMQDRASFVTSVCSFDLLAGNSYVEKDIAGRTIQLYARRPDRMSVVPGVGMPSAYEFKVGQKSHRFPVDPITGESDILHLKHFHPSDDWYGLSPLAAAAYSVDQHNAASLWNMGILQNSGKPSGAMRYAPKEGDGEMPDEMFHRLRAQLDEQSGASGKPGRPMLLEGGLDWVQMSLTSKDLDWLDGIDKAASYIAQAFNVPEQLVGVPGQQTYNNYREARLALYEDAVLPLLNRLCLALTEWLVQPYAGPEWRLEYDQDQIPALALRREQQWDRINASDDLTINEKRLAKGYEAVEGGDVVLVPAGMLPLSFAADPPEFPTDEKSGRTAYGE